MNVGTNIRILRKEKGLTQKELADAVQVTQSMLCQIERGSKPPSLPLCLAITDALGCTMGDLIGAEAG